MDELRYMCNLGAERCKVFAAISQCGDGYSMVCASKTVPLKKYSALICDKGKGKCGGSDLMLTGRLSAIKKEIISLFEEEIK